MWKETRSFLPVPSQSEISRSAKTLKKLFRTPFLKCHTESKAGCLNKMNTDMSSKATTNRRTWKFILRARKKSFSYPRQAKTWYLSGSRQYHDRQSIRMILWGYRVWNGLLEFFPFINSPNHQKDFDGNEYFMYPDYRLNKIELLYWLPCSQTIHMRIYL